ncbi:hypothetical protein ACFXNW_10625 [Nocardia sp. NPDC059180]|uniref:hypothetical protein n=1 Tax=Nocardia sp. NPDC059180 TaxID=3346761 RepID=UPI003695EA11
MLIVHHDTLDVEAVRGAQQPALGFQQGSAVAAQGLLEEYDCVWHQKTTTLGAAVDPTWSAASASR